MKKAQLTAVIVLVVVAIIVAGQAFAGWGGGRRAGRGPGIEQGSRIYHDRLGPMGQRSPWYGAPGPEWERGVPGPLWQGRGRQQGQRPYAQRPRPNHEAGRTYGVCPHCGAWLGAGPGGRNDFGPETGRSPQIGAGAGRDQGFRRGQLDRRQRSLGRGDIAERRRLPKDNWEQGPPRPYGGEQGLRRGDAQRPGRNRMDNWQPPQRRRMNRPRPDGFGPVRPEDGDQNEPPRPPRGRRGFRPQAAPGNQTEQPPQEKPQIEAPDDSDGPQVEQ